MSSQLAEYVIIALNVLIILIFVGAIYGCHAKARCNICGSWRLWIVKVLEPHDEGENACVTHVCRCGSCKQYTNIQHLVRE